MKNAYRDGIVNRDVFNKCKKRILWILKEVNHDGELDDWDMCEILRTEIKGEKGINPGWSNTFAPIIYSTYGILNNLKWHEIPYCNEKPEIIDVLNSIAYMNVKRTSGGANVDYQKLSEAYKENKNLLFNQINEINPSIIIYGGTFYLFENDLDLISNKNVTHISAYHPAHRGNKEIYCNQIIETALA